MNIYVYLSIHIYKHSPHIYPVSVATQHPPWPFFVGRRGTSRQGFPGHLLGIRQAQQDVLADAAGEEHRLLGDETDDAGSTMYRQCK